MDDKEKAIREIVQSAVTGYASKFSNRHLKEVGDPNGTINKKIHNGFIAHLGSEVQYFSALARSLDSSLGNMLEKMAVEIAERSYVVQKHVDGYITKSQTEFIARLLEEYKRHAKTPSISDYAALASLGNGGETIQKRHESDYYIEDKDAGQHYLIELKIGGDLDNKKARSEKEALLEQYCILCNSLKTDANVHLKFATAYNRLGEGNDWKQSRVLQFFSKEELLISSDFWNFICKSDRGYEIVIDAYRQNAHHITDALETIKKAYLPNG